jgi:hypothetical protein
VYKTVDEVIQHLSAKYGTKVRITRDIEAESREGFDEAAVRAVSGELMAESIFPWYFDFAGKN